MKCFRLRCYVNNSFLVFHQGTKHSKTIKHSRFALVFHTVFSCLDPLMKHSNSLFTYNIKVVKISKNNNSTIRIFITQAVSSVYQILVPQYILIPQSGYLLRKQSVVSTILLLNSLCSFSDEYLETKIDFIISLGGDGTLLYAASLFQVCVIVQAQ